ncbi:unnamed protein product [Nezara viridula]|uniref:Uncharacterized protein n=1 Tax=Nezara viridula TaxID=85310 RepID=A0A9P0H599_NEZVI|nr:unnamed protein product [Nezara viridula]
METEFKSIKRGFIPKVYKATHRFLWKVISLHRNVLLNFISLIEERRLNTSKIKKKFELIKYYKISLLTFKGPD